MTVVGGGAQAHIGHHHKVVTVFGLEFHHGPMKVRGRIVSMTRISILVFAGDHAEQHHGAKTVSEVFGHGFEQNIHRLLMDARHATNRFVHARPFNNEVRLDEGRQHPAVKQQVAASCRPAIDARSDVHLNPSCVLATISRALPR